MASSTHTPGPWKVSRHDPYSVVSGDDWFYVAEAEILDDEAEQLANVRLIAAAPDLLASLRELVDDHCAANCSQVSDEHTVECLRASAAIAKAAGPSCGGGK